MKTHKIKKVKKIIGFLVWAIIPLLPLAIPNIQNQPKLWLLISSGYIVWLLKLSIDTFDAVNFFWNKLYLSILNREVNWSMTAGFDGDFNKDILSLICNEIFRIQPKAEYWQNSDRTKIIKLPFGGTIKLGFTTELNGDDEEVVKLTLAVSDIIVPFRNSKKILYQLINLIKRAVREVAQPTTEKYNLNISFGDTNPYFGLFVRRLRLPDQQNVSFNVSFHEHIGVDEGRVEVGAEKVVVVTRDLASLQTLSCKYITLSSLNLGEV